MKLFAMINEETLRQQYREHEVTFNQIKEQLYDALKRAAQGFYQKRRFEIKVLPPRLKKIDSVIGKLKRKERSADSLFQRNEDVLTLVVNDFLGARISCNTKEDVREIAALIKENRRFRIVEEKDWAKDNGYRALHLDMQFEVHWYDDLLYIPVEIQIKTHLQSAWGDITHSESYKPIDENLKNEADAYSKHIADVLDVLDGMASTIRHHRLSVVEPPPSIDEEDMNINAKTLSYKIAQQHHNSNLLTQQEMDLIIERLRLEGFESIAEVNNLLTNGDYENKIKKSKEELRNNGNVTPFEMLYYGSLLKDHDGNYLKEAMRKDYGFVENHCEDCHRPLSATEFKFLNEKTDIDLKYFCEDHRSKHLTHNCQSCGILTSKILCKNCEAEDLPF